MIPTAIFFAVIKVAITIALATLFFRSGYRIGYHDYSLGRSSRIPVPALDEDDQPDDPASDDHAPHIAGFLPAPSGFDNQKGTTVDAPAANPLSHTIVGTITNLSIRRTSKGQSVAVFELADGSESTTCVVFPKLFSASCDLLAEGAPVRVSGGLETSRGCTQLVCRQIDPLA